MQIQQEKPLTLCGESFVSELILLWTDTKERKAFQVSAKRCGCCHLWMEKGWVGEFLSHLLALLAVCPHVLAICPVKLCIQRITGHVHTDSHLCPLFCDFTSEVNEMQNEIRKHKPVGMF